MDSNKNQKIDLTPLQEYFTVETGIDSLIDDLEKIRISYLEMAVFSLEKGSCVICGVDTLDHSLIINKLIEYLGRCKVDVAS